MAMTGGIAALVKEERANFGQDNWTIKLYVYYKTSQDIANNKSTVTVGMYVETPGSAYDIGSWTDHGGSYIGVGTSNRVFVGTIPNFGGMRWLVENQTFTVNHNNDGTGIATINWKWGVNSPWGGYQEPSGYFTITLPTIPRASTISGVSNVTLGNACNVRWSPASTSFRYKLKFVLGSWSYTTPSIHPNQTSEYTYSDYIIPLTVANQLPNATTGFMTVYLYTYSDSKCLTQIGSIASSLFAVTVPKGDNCMDILVNVANQKLKIATNLKNFVAGTQEFIKFKFNLSSDWDNLLIFAQFQQNGEAYNQYLDENNSVYLPSEIEMGTCKLMLYGSNNKTIATTNYLTLFIDENILVTDAKSTEISESLYMQLVSKVNDFEKYTEEVIKDAEVATDNAKAATEEASEAIKATEKATEAANEAEFDRASAESARVLAENGRVTAETARVEAESQRVDAEDKREKKVETAITRITEHMNKIISNANDAAEGAENVNISVAQTETGATVTVTNREGVENTVHIEPITVGDSGGGTPSLPSDFNSDFSKNSWETIAYVCKNLNPADYWNIGDRKNLTINGVDIPVTIIGFNHDKVSNEYKSTYGKSTAGMTLQIGATRAIIPDMTKDSMLNFNYDNIPFYHANGEEGGKVVIVDEATFAAQPYYLGANVGDLVKHIYRGIGEGWYLVVNDTSWAEVDYDTPLNYYLVDNNGNQVEAQEGDYFTIKVKNTYVPKGNLEQNKYVFDDVYGGYGAPNQTPQSTTGHYWGTSDTRIELQSLLNGTGIEDKIVSVKKYTSKYYNKSNMYAAPEITNDNVFLPSEYEIFGDIKYSPFREGDQYEYYKDGNSKFMWSNSAIDHIVHKKAYRELLWLRSCVASEVNTGSHLSIYNCAVANEVNTYPNDVPKGLGVNYEPAANNFGVDKNIIYIADTPAGDGDGSSYDNRMGNSSSYYDETNTAYQGSALYKAFDKLKNTGGTIVVCGNLTINRANALRDSAAEFVLPSNGFNLITITSLYDGTDYRLLTGDLHAQIVLDKSSNNVNFSINGITLWHHLDFDIPKMGAKIENRFDATFLFECNGYKTVFGQGISMALADSNNPYPTICGRGRYGSKTEPTIYKYGSITVKSGNWQEICGTVFTTKLGENLYQISEGGSIQINFVGGQVRTISGGSSRKSQGGISIFKGNININIRSANFDEIRTGNTSVRRIDTEVDGNPIIYGGSVVVNIVRTKLTAGAKIYGRPTSQSTSNAEYILNSSYDIDSVLDSTQRFDNVTDKNPKAYIKADLKPTYTDTFFYGKIAPCFCL